MDAEAYKVGIFLLRHFKRLFPDFYATHIAERPVTPASMRSAIEAFLSLVNRDLFVTEETYDLWFFADPEQAFTRDYGDDPLDAVGEASYWLYQPHAAFYGIGVQTLRDGGYNDDPPSYTALTLALWKLFDGTQGSLGVDVADYVGDFLPAVQRQIINLAPLPPYTPFEDVCRALVMPDRPWSKRIADLVRYAFGQTDNPLANYTPVEVAEIWDGETSDEWEDAEGIAESARDATEIAHLYGLWEQAVALHPKREIDALAAALHTAAAPWVGVESAPLISRFLEDDEPTDWDQMDDLFRPRDIGDREYGLAGEDDELVEEEV